MNGEKHSFYTKQMLQKTCIISPNVKWMIKLSFEYMAVLKS